MARLNKPKRKALSLADFEQYPIWVWDDSNESHQPISETEPSTDDYGTLFIKARFEADAHSFDGYLIGGHSFYAFGLFVEDREFVFNLHLLDLMEVNMSEIYQLLGCRPFGLLPLRFASPVRFQGGKPITGVFEAPTLA